MGFVENRRTFYKMTQIFAQKHTFGKDFLSYKLEKWAISNTQKNDISYHNYKDKIETMVQYGDQNFVKSFGYKKLKKEKSKNPQFLANFGCPSKRICHKEVDTFVGVTLVDTY